MLTLIIPGWQQSREHWKYCSQALSARGIAHAVVDMPGFGTEPYQQNLRSVDDYAQWLDRYVQQYYPHTEVVLIGHSFGGRVAVSLAATQPPWLKGLVLIGSPNLYRPDRGTKLKKQFAKLVGPLKYLIPENVRAWLRSSDYQAAKDTPLQALYQTVITTDQSQHLSTIPIPVYLLWGELDLSVPLSIAREMQIILPNATLEVLHNGGHDLHLEKYDLLAAKIKQYVESF